MAKTKAASVPDTHTLRVLLEEYLQMLREAERGVKKALSLEPVSEGFWDELAELYPHITNLESRSSSIQMEIEDLIDELPED
jgi:hypothetical protein